MLKIQSKMRHEIIILIIFIALIVLVFALPTVNTIQINDTTPQTGDLLNVSFTASDDVEYAWFYGMYNESLAYFWSLNNVTNNNTFDLVGNINLSLLSTDTEYADAIDTEHNTSGSWIDEYFYDNDWGTSSAKGIGSSYYYFNHTTPVSADPSEISVKVFWTISEGTLGNQTLTIDALCYNATMEDKIMFRITMASSEAYLHCYNGTDWSLLQTNYYDAVGSSEYLGETSMFWNHTYPNIIDTPSYRGLSFNGYNWLNSSTTDININNTFTIEAYINLTDTDNQQILDIKNPGTQKSRIFFRFYKDDESSLNFSGAIYDKGGVNYKHYLTSGITSDEYHHAVMTWDGESMELYIDGVNMSVVKSNDDSVELSDSLQRYVLIGTSQNGWYTNGTIDYVKIYNTSLSSTQIETLNRTREGYGGNAITFNTSKYLLNDQLARGDDIWVYLRGFNGTDYGNYNVSTNHANLSNAPPVVSSDTNTKRGFTGFECVVGV